MNRIIKVLQAPGARASAQYAAETQFAPTDIKHESNSVILDNVPTSELKDKKRLFDRWLDKVVEFSGSEFMFFTIVSALPTWAFLGIRFGQSNTWQVTISDAQAIVNMVFDAFIMRQQLNAHASLMMVSACLRSRARSSQRMLRTLVSTGKAEQIDQTQFQHLQQTEFFLDLPGENWFGRLSTGVSNVMGHIITVGLFWAGIFLWVGFGKHCNWSNTWQLVLHPHGCDTPDLSIDGVSSRLPGQYTGAAPEIHNKMPRVDLCSGFYPRI